MLLGGAAIAQQKPSQFAPSIPASSIVGRATVQMTVGKTYGEYPLARLKLYLLRAEDGKALHALQRKCRQALARTSSAPGATYDICSASQEEAAQLVPTLAAAATAQTDRDGNYRFDAVPAGGRYQVVGVKMEGGEATLIVGLTALLKPGAELKLNLSENDDWTQAVPPAK
jgi:hypothetical protein